MIGVSASLIVEAEQPGAIAAGERPAEGAAGDARENLVRARSLFFGKRAGAGAARQEPQPDRRLADAGRVVRAVDAEVPEVREAGQPGEVPRRQVGQRLVERHDEVLHGAGGALNERGGYLLRSRPDANRLGPEHVGRPQLAVEIEQGHPLAVHRDLYLFPLGRDVVAEEGPDAGEIERQPEDVVAVGGEVVRDGDAAARAERRAGDVPHLREGLRDDVGVYRRRGVRVAHRHPCDPAGGGQVALQQGRRDGQDVRHVVVALAHVVRRQERRRVDVETEQVADRVRVLGPVQPVQDGSARVGRRRRGAVEAGFELTDERGEDGRLGARPALGRHHAGPQLQDHLLESGGVQLRVIRIGALQGQAAGARPVVVAGGAVLPQQGVSVHLRRGRRLRGGGGRGCGQKCGDKQPDRRSGHGFYASTAALTGAPDRDAPSVR